MAKKALKEVNEAQGFIQDITENTVTVDGHIIYIPPEKTAKFKEEKYVKDEAVGIKYDKKAALIEIWRLNPEPKQPFSKVLEGGDKTTKDAGYVHIQEEHLTKTPPQQPVAGTPPDSSGMHMNKPPVSAVTEIPAKVWFNDQVRNDYILMQSVMERAVEIVNAYYADPKVFDTVTNTYHADPKVFDTALENRVTKIKNISKELFEFVKQVVQDEQRKQGNGS